MTSDQTPDTSLEPAAPPTHPGAIGLTEPRSGWPTVIGIIAIVLAALVVLGATWGLVATFLFSDGMPGLQAGQAAVIAATASLRTWTWIGGFLSLGVGILLLAGGIGLIQRRRWSPKAIMVWAIAQMVSTLYGSVLNYTSQQAMFETMAQDPNMSAMPGGFVAGMGVAMVAGGICMGWAPAVFALIWFSRRKIKDEVAGWG